MTSPSRYDPDAHGRATVAVRSAGEPPVWWADLIRAAYRNDRAAAQQAVAHLGESDTRALHRALRNMVAALMTGRQQAAARKHITGTVVDQ